MATQPDDLHSPENARRRQLHTLIDLSNKFGDSLANAFANSVAEGKRVSGDAERCRADFARHLRQH